MSTRSTIKIIVVETESSTRLDFEIPSRIKPLFTLDAAAHLIRAVVDHADFEAHKIPELTKVQQLCEEFILNYEKVTNTEIEHTAEFVDRGV